MEPRGPWALLRASRFGRPLVVTGAAVPLYAALRGWAEAAGTPVIPTMLPLPWSVFDLWPVLPGAFLSALVLDFLAGRFHGPLRLVAGGLLGALLGLANAPLAVLVALVGFHVLTPWKYGFLALLEEWWRQFPVVAFLGLPVAVPCGFLLGLLLSALSLAAEARPGSKPD